LFSSSPNIPSTVFSIFSAAANPRLSPAARALSLSAIERLLS
jgi:hypothetical protein